MKDSYHILVLMKGDRWECTGEGPFDSREEAEIFAVAEVGASWTVTDITEPCDWCDA